MFSPCSAKRRASEKDLPVYKAFVPKIKNSLVCSRVPLVIYNSSSFNTFFVLSLVLSEMRSFWFRKSISFFHNQLQVHVRVIVQPLKSFCVECKMRFCNLCFENQEYKRYQKILMCAGVFKNLCKYIFIDRLLYVIFAELIKSGALCLISTFKTSLKVEAKFNVAF